MNVAAQPRHLPTAAARNKKTVDNEHTNNEAYGDD